MKKSAVGVHNLWRWLAVGTASFVVVWIYFWIQRPAISQLLGNHSAKTAYYNRLVDGFRSGHLYLAGDPAPELATLKNPYDPIENGPYRLHDATYYKGKYYLYFGATPALVLFWPYVAVTGEYLWHRQAVAIFGSAAFLISVGLLCAAQRRYFPKAGPVTLFFVVLGLGMANTVPIVLRRPDVWEVPIMCAAMFVMLALAAIWRALHEPTRRVFWVTMASAAYGFAIGARPPVLLGAAILLSPAVYAWWREKAEGRHVAKLVAAAVVPITLFGLAVLCYNWLRFDHPLEFGQKYQLAGVDNTKVTFFDPSYFWYHLRLYLWEPSGWSIYFPFVTGIHVPPPPPGQLGVESVFGLLTNNPFVWFALAAPFAALPGSAERKTWRWMILTALLISAICGLTVCLFGGACNRYFVDFVLPWVWVAATGVLAIEHRLAERQSPWRGAARLGWWAALVFSSAFIFFSSCQHLGLLRLRDPQSYSRVAWFCNWPVAQIESLLGAKYGSLELTVRFPPFTGRRAEPILVTGVAGEADYFWVEYIDPSHLRFGLEHTNYGGPVSEPLEVDYGREHTLTLQFRSLYPPEDHAYWTAADGRATAETRNRMELLFNYRVAIQGTVVGYDASPLTRFIGRSPYVRDFGSEFTGQVLRQRTLGPPAPEQLRAPGPVAFKLWLPRDKPPRHTEPLVQTGEAGKADTLWIRYVDDRHIAFGLDHWGYGGPETGPIEVDYAQVQRLEIRLGSFYPPEHKWPTTDPRRRRLEVKLNGAVVLQAETDFYPARSSQVHFGRNIAGASTASERLSGRIADLWRLGIDN